MTALDLGNRRVVAFSNGLDQMAFEHIFCELFPSEKDMNDLTLELLLMHDFEAGLGVLSVMGPLRTDPATIVGALYRAVAGIFATNWRVTKLLRRQGLLPLLKLLHGGLLSEDNHRLWCQRLSAMRHALRMKRNALEEKLEPTFWDRERLLFIHRRLHLLVGMEDMLQVTHPTKVTLGDAPIHPRYDEMLKGYRRVWAAAKVRWQPIRPSQGPLYWPSFFNISHFSLSAHSSTVATRKVVREFLRMYEAPPQTWH